MEFLISILTYYHRLHWNKIMFLRRNFAAMLSELCETWKFIVNNFFVSELTYKVCGFYLLYRSVLMHVDYIHCWT